MTCEQSEMNLFGETIVFQRTKKYFIVPEDENNVIAYEKNGDAVLVQNDYGKGRVFYLNFPLEQMLLAGTERFENNHYLIYKTLLRDTLEKHCVTCNIPSVGITHHYEGEDAKVVIINYSDRRYRLDLKIHEDYEIFSVIKGCIELIEPFSTIILKVTKKKKL